MANEIRHLPKIENNNIVIITIVKKLKNVLIVKTPWIKMKKFVPLVVKNIHQN